jgi:aryl-alcohol dehydrogenase-like predicted oxidoreductase
MGLGCWQLGGSDWGDVDEATAFATLRAALDAGVDFLDTADVYGGGRSEELIGRFMREVADRPFVATKVGRFAGCGFPDQFTFTSIRDCTEASLRRLGVEALDLTQLHCVPTEVLRQGEVFEWLRQLKQEGKILRFGASVESMEEALLCLEQEGLCSLQIIFNLFRQKPINVLFERVKAAHTAVIVRLPLASGLLGGRYTRETRFGASDHRTYNRDGQAFNVGETFAGLEFERGVELAEALKAYVPEGLSLPQMAMRWILDYPEVSVVIPGARDAAQAHANAALSLLPPLPASLHRQLSAFYKAQVTGHIRGPY